MFSKTSQSVILSVLVLIPFAAVSTDPSLGAPGTPTTVTKSSQLLAGTWRIQGKPNKLPGFINIASITTDGEIINVDPNLGTGVGTASHVRSSRYDVTFHGFNNPATLETYEVRGTITLGRGRRSFAGPFVTTIRDAAGKVTFRFAGTVLATRM